MHTLQETFDMSCLALIKQGEPALKDESCWYLTGDGRRCAAGHLMTGDPEVLQALTGFAVEDSEASPFLMEHDIRFVRRLQVAHDGAIDGEKSWRVNWLRKIRIIAETARLDASRVLEAAKAAGWEVPA